MPRVMIKKRKLLSAEYEILVFLKSAGHTGRIVHMSRERKSLQIVEYELSVDEFGEEYKINLAFRGKRLASMIVGERVKVNKGAQ